MKELPKAYEPNQYEDKIYQKWEKSGFFNPDNLLLKKDAPSYTIVLPPPNVTGTLHLGHAAMLAIEDNLIRYHRLKGERALWLPGTDHAAIATQTKVEKIIKEEGTDRHKLGRQKFLNRVEKFARESHNTIVNQIKKMGSSCDWKREAFTLDETRNKAVRSVFKMMYDEGLIYRGERIVNWCPRCHSTLADDEVEYKEQKSILYYFKYAKDFPLTIATTRPETKLGDTAVAINSRDKRYKKLAGKEYKIDFIGIPLQIKIITDRSVDMDFAAGAVGVTPAHSIADWQMAETNKLKIIKVINEDGFINNGFGEYSGKSAKEAREVVVKNLKKAGLLEKEAEVNNNLSICYRCGTAIEPLPSLQWFIDVNKKIPRYGKSIKELSVDAVKKGVFGRKKINIIPERFEKNYFHWMENLRDWCISRQIWYGHQVPVWYKDRSKVKSQKSKVIPTSNFQLPNDLTEKEIYVGESTPRGQGWAQDPDTLDTWFSSGLWTFSTLAEKPEQIKIKDGKLHISSNDYKNFHPTSVLETGYDILFFWVARMIIMTTYAVGDIPFQDIYLHGLVLDEKGKKMSKSKGNVIDPLEMAKKYGADAVRLSLLIGATPGNDVRLSEEKVGGFRNFINKLWNISRFIITNYTYTPDNSVGNLSVADTWILSKKKKLIDEITADLDNYRFSQAGEKLREFTWNDFADWYLEVCKFERDTNKETILFSILKDLLKLWHPFIPFVTETIWGKLSDTLIMVDRWPQSNRYSGLVKGTNGKNFELIKEIIIAIRNARNENKVEPNRKIKAIIYSKNHKELLESQTHLIKSLRTGIEDLTVKDKGEKIAHAICIVISDIEIYLLGAYDESKNQERIKKETEQLIKRINIIETKLKNKHFIKNAPKEIVMKEKEKLALLKLEMEKLKEI